MAKFMVKKSELKNICKSVDDRKLAELKKEIIEILKKQDGKEFKKAIDYLESQELHFTHLEKSITGKWVEKAGYGIGTVRVWKGKKYKKIAPDKWVRVFDKEGRGTNIAIGKLIAKVQKIDNVEDLMAFVMANKQRFVDENGIDLPVLDKLRAAVDAKNNGSMGSKGTSKPAKKEDEKTQDDYEKEYEQSLKGKNDAETLDNIVEAYDSLAKELRPEAKEKGVAVNELNNPKLEALGQLRLRYSEKNISEGEKKYREEIEKLSGRMKEAIDNEFGYEKESEEENRSKMYNLQKKLLELNKKRNENNEEIKRLNGDLAKTKQDKAEDEVRGNSTTEYDKKIKDLNTKIDNLLDENADIEVEGNETYKQLSELNKEVEAAREKEKEPETKKEPAKVKTSSVNLGVTADGKEIKVTKSTDAKKKIGIAKATLEDDKFIVPATKELDDTVKTMEKFFKDVDANNRIMLKGFGIVDGFLCATDGRQAVRIKIDGLDDSVGDCVKIRKEGNNYIIEQDDLTTTWEETTDDWSRGYKQMKKETRTADRKTQKYPNVSRAIPDNATETMNLDTAALKDVIKQLKKEKFLSSSTVRTDANHYLPVVIKDGNLTIDGKVVGTIPDKEIEKETAWDFRFIENALGMGANSFNYSPEKMKESTTWPLVASTNIGDTVFMSAQPMSKMTTWDKESDQAVEVDKLTQHREEMVKQKEKEEAKNKAMYESNKGFVDHTIENVKRSIKPDFSEKMIEKIQNYSTDDLKNLWNQAKLDIDDLMNKRDMYSSNFSKYTNKNFNTSPSVLIAQNYAMKEYPEIVTEIEKILESRGEKIKKSLFDDFVIDMFVDEDEEEIEEEKKAESLFNDYTAEQPELFNSTELMVSEAMNRHFCNCL